MWPATSQIDRAIKQTEIFIIASFFFCLSFENYEAKPSETMKSLDSPRASSIFSIFYVLDPIFLTIFYLYIYFVWWLDLLFALLYKNY